MADSSVIDIIHNLSYRVDKRGLDQALAAIEKQTAALNALIKKSQELSAALKAPAEQSTLAHKQAEAELARINQQLENQSKLIAKILTDNKYLQDAYKREEELVKALEDKLKRLESARSSATRVRPSPDLSAMSEQIDALLIKKRRLEGDLQDPYYSGTDTARQIEAELARVNAELARYRSASGTAATQNTRLNETMQQESGIINDLEARLRVLGSARRAAMSRSSIAEYDRQIRGVRQQLNAINGAGGSGIRGQVGNALLMGLGIGGGLLAFQAISGAVREVKDFTKDSVRAAISFQQMQVAFTTMVGDADKANDLLTQLQGLSLKSTFGFEQATEFAKRLLAYGIPVQNIVTDIKSLGDVSAGVGKEKMPSLILAFGQIASKGRLMGQELRQLTEAGFNPLEIISEKTGESMASLTQKMGKGLISFQMVEQAFQDATREGGRFNSLMQKQLTTTGGAITHLGATVDLLKIAIGQNLNGSVASLVNSFQQLVEITYDWIKASPAEELEKQRVGFNALVQQLILANKGEGDRKQIIQDLKTEYPTLIKNINLETASNAQLLTMLNSVNASYAARIQIAGAAALADKQAQENVDLVQKQEQARTTAYQALSEGGLSSSDQASIDLQSLSLGQIQDIANKLKNVAGFFDTYSTPGKFQRAVLILQQTTKELDKGLKAGNDYNKRLSEVKEQNSQRNVIVKRIADLQKENEAISGTGESIANSIVPGFQLQGAQSIIANNQEIARLNKELYDLDHPVKPKEVPIYNPADKNKKGAKPRTQEQILKDEYGDIDAQIKAEIHGSSKITQLKALQLANIKAYNEYLKSDKFNSDTANQRKGRENEFNSLNEVIGNQIKLETATIELKGITLKKAAAFKIGNEAEVNRWINEALDKQTEIAKIPISLEVDLTAQQFSSTAASSLKKEIDKQQDAEDTKELTRIQHRKDAEIAAYYAIEDAAITTANAILDAQLRAMDKEIAYRQYAVQQAEFLAERGNTAVLKAETDRLQKATEAREKAANRQVELSALITAAKQAENVANAIGAVVEAAAEGDPYTIAFRVVAAVAALSAGIATVTAAFNNNSSGFAEGGYTGDGGKYQVAGPVHRGEFVMDAEHTKQFRPMLEAMHQDKFKMPVISWRKVNVPLLDENKGYATKQDFNLLASKLDDVTEAVYATKIRAENRLDGQGVTQLIEKHVTNDRRRFR